MLIAISKPVDIPKDFIEYIKENGTPDGYSTSIATITTLTNNARHYGMIDRVDNKWVVTNK